MLGAFGPHGCHTLHHFHDFQCLPGGHPFFGVSCGAVGRCFAFTSREKKGFPGGASGIKSLPANAGDLRNADLIPGLGRSPGGGHGNHFSILAWRNPWTEDPGGLQSIGSQRVEHD